MSLPAGVIVGDGNLCVHLELGGRRLDCRLRVGTLP